MSALSPCPPCRITAASNSRRRSICGGLPSDLVPQDSGDGRLSLKLGSDGACLMNDWSFGQLAKLAGVSKETVNRLSPDTAARVFEETLPRTNKPMQLYRHGDILRSIHGTSYTRVHDADLVAMLQEFAVDFQPPQKGFNGATGLYAGEQDLFCFLIDPNGWTEIEGEAFAPGFFIWNSEVGKRSIGIETFWFQAVCQNHIVWDATEVVEFTRKHTSSVHAALSEMRRIVEGLVAKRDERKDGFMKVIAKAMHTKLGDDAEEVLNTLAKNGIGRNAAKQALEIAQQQGRFTIFACGRCSDAAWRARFPMPGIESTPMPRPGPCWLWLNSEGGAACGVVSVHSFVLFGKEP